MACMVSQLIIFLSYRSRVHGSILICGELLTFSLSLPEFPLGILVSFLLPNYMAGELATVHCPQT